MRRFVTNIQFYLNMDGLRKIIGQNVKRFRERLGLTQEALADYLEIPREVISYYETGAREIPVVKLNQIAQILYVDVADLLEEDEKVAKASAAFAFRANSLSKNDLANVGDFLKIVKNHIRMTELNKEKSE